MTDALKPNLSLGPPFPQLPRGHQCGIGHLIIGGFNIQCHHATLLFVGKFRAYATGVKGAAALRNFVVVGSHC